MVVRTTATLAAMSAIVRRSLDGNGPASLGTRTAAGIVRTSASYVGGDNGLGGVAWITTVGDGHVTSSHALDGADFVCT
jgi:hypothetical protein